MYRTCLRGEGKTLIPDALFHTYCIARASGGKAKLRDPYNGIDGDCIARASGGKAKLRYCYTAVAIYCIARASGGKAKPLAATPRKPFDCIARASGGKAKLKPPARRISMLLYRTCLRGEGKTRTFWQDAAKLIVSHVPPGGRQNGWEAKPETKDIVSHVPPGGRQNSSSRMLSFTLIVSHVPPGGRQNWHCHGIRRAFYCIARASGGKAKLRAGLHCDSIALVIVSHVPPGGRQNIALNARRLRSNCIARASGGKAKLRRLAAFLALHCIARASGGKAKQLPQSTPPVQQLYRTCLRGEGKTKSPHIGCFACMARQDETSPLPPTASGLRSFTDWRRCAP